MIGEVREGAFSSEVLRRSVEGLPEGELRLVSTLFYLCLRRLPLWEELLSSRVDASRLPPFARELLLVGLCGLLELRRFSRASLVNALVEACKGRYPGLASLVNAVLRSFCRDLDRGLVVSGLEAHGRLGSSPWFFERLLGPLGERGRRSFLSMRPLPSLLLRDGSSGEEVLSEARSGGLRPFPSPLSPLSVRLCRGVIPSRLSSFARGLCSQASESTALVVEVLSSLPSPGGLLVDLCAGRGVKLSHLLALRPDLRALALEISPARARALAGNLRRMGVRGRAEVEVRDSTRAELPPRGLFLLDAPCTGSGTAHRHPEIRWRLGPGGLEGALEIQRRLLRRALEGLEEGYLVYSVCSLFPEEGEEMVSSSMGLEGVRAVSVDLPPAWSRFARRGRWGFQVLPLLPWLDGFYVSVLEVRRR